MSTHRGRGRLLTSEELRDLLAIPLYYLVTGKAQVIFPNTSRPAPSSFVQIIRTGRVRGGHAGYFPVTVGWKQWKEVVVPVIQDGSFVSWLGLLGGTTGETDDGLPLAIPNERVEANLYGANPDRWVYLLGLKLKAQADDSGYGTGS